MLKNYNNFDEKITPFHLIITDASGNSFINNPNPQIADNHLKTIKFS